MRGEKQEIIDKKQLVPGDIVMLDPGDIIPAEMRIISLSNFLVDESVLTGESVPVFKVSEPLAGSLASIHNLRYLMRICEEYRK